MTGARLAPLSEEFLKADLGDARLNQRLMRIADLLAAAPGSSFPEQAGDSGELEGIYRFLENERVSPMAILDSHVQETVQRTTDHEEVLVLHDTTEFRFGGEERREGLGWLNAKGRQGFLGHFSFAVTPSGEPLGTVGLYAWTRQGARKGRRPNLASQYDPNRESLRWQESALLTGELLFGHTQAIHVMDREGDCYELFSLLLEHEQRFVIRLSHDRRLQHGRATKTGMLFDELSNAPFYLERQVPVASRGAKKRSSRERKKFPPRKSRQARLEVRAKPLEIYIGNGSVAHVPRSLSLQFVQVQEVDPPLNEEPVLWRLVTTEPVTTKEQVARVVDFYRRRWLIEEFFKALKTGCRYQQRQLETAHALLVDLAIESAVAWRLLLIRAMSRQKPGAPASVVLNDTQVAALTILRASRGRALPQEPTVTDVLYAVAALGGHIKNNGPPGWLVLRRGFEKLEAAEQMALAMTANPQYKPRSDQ